MKLKDVLFTGMNIPNEVRKLLSHVNVTTTNGMTTNEYKAYKMGVENALSAAGALLNQDIHLVFHINDNSCAEEFDLDELIEFVEEKEGFLYE